MYIDRDKGILLGVGCVLAGLVVGSGIGYVEGHKEASDKLSRDILDLVDELESEDNSLAESSKKSLHRAKGRAFKVLSTEGFGLRNFLSYIGSHIQRAIPNNFK